MPAMTAIHRAVPRDILSPPRADMMTTTTTPMTPTIQLNPDPKIAEQQIEAVIFYLTTCGYIDTEFDLREKAFIRAFLRELVTARIDAQGPLDPELRFERIEAQHEHYLERFQEIDHDIKGLLTEAVADGEDPQRFVLSQLKLRCFEIGRASCRERVCSTV